MNDYWLRQKYRMSGLKLLAEIASMSSDAKEKIFSDWFAYCDEDSDPICRKITRCARDGICANKPIQEIVDDMIRVIPEEERMKPDIKGFKFVSNVSGEIVERVYSEKEQKYKLRAIYPGLLPGSDSYGDSFADLAYGYESQGAIRDLEEYVAQGSMIEWGKIVSCRCDDDLTALATALSQMGRHLLFAGLEDERLPNIVIKAVLSGRCPDENADTVAENILNERREKQ